MTKIKLSTISKTDFQRLVHLQELKGKGYDWTQFDQLPLTATEQQRLQYLQADLLKHKILWLNEATVWSLAIYPLLLLAESEDIQVWAEVTLQAQYPQFEIDGIADGVFGKTVTGSIEAPYLVVVEAKRRMESQNPLFQLYGQLLAAAYLNWQQNNQLPQEIFGCYTVADIWTFIRAEVEEIEADIPTLRVEYSREYVEKLEASTILKILKGIISKVFKVIN
jgi:hypothetical protein